MKSEKQIGKLKPCLKVGDLVTVHNFDVGVITHIDEENETADVEIEHYDYKTELPYKFSELRRF